MKILMEVINYDKFKWQICGDLKVIVLLLGLQQEFTKYCCFICKRDSRILSLHYSRKDWSPGKSLVPGIMNVENQPQVGSSKILLPSIHLKLCLMNDFVKAMNQEEDAFTYLRVKFPRLSEAKVKTVFSLVHKYETLSMTNTSTSSFKVTKSRLGAVFNL